jgi:hypothetical protein
MTAPRLQRILMVVALLACGVSIAGAQDGTAMCAASGDPVQPSGPILCRQRPLVTMREVLQRAAPILWFSADEPLLVDGRIGVDTPAAFPFDCEAKGAARRLLRRQADQRAAEEYRRRRTRPPLRSRPSAERRRITEPTKADALAFTATARSKPSAHRAPCSGACGATHPGLSGADPNRPLKLRARRTLRRQGPAAPYVRPSLGSKNPLPTP